VPAIAAADDARKTAKNVRRIIAMLLVSGR
jgi:hypothetical protein